MGGFNTASFPKLFYLLVFY